MESSIFTHPAAGTSSREFPDSFEDLPGMTLGLGIGPCELHYSLGVDEHTASDDPEILFAVHLFEAPGPVGFQDPVVGIAQKPHSQPLFFRELLVRGH